MTDVATWTIVLLGVLAASLLSGFPVALCLAGSSLLVSVLASFAGAFDLSLLMALPNRIYSAMSNPVLVSVPLFIFMGFLLERSHIAEDLLHGVAALFGSRTGGIAVSVCLVGALLAASTGIVGATVVTMGLLALPTMSARGYSPAVASGTICAAGTLGQIIPPSIVLILLGDQLSGAWQTAQYERGNFAPEAVSINDLFAGALLPGLLLVTLYILYIIVLAQVKPDLMPALENEEDSQNQAQRRRKLQFLYSVLPPVVLILAVLGSILAGIASPTEAASIGAIGALLLADHRLYSSRPSWIRYSAMTGVGAAVLAFMLSKTSDLTLPLQTSTGLDTTIRVTVAALIAVLAVAVGIAVKRLYQTESTNVNHDPNTLTVVPIMSDVLRRTVVTTSMIFLILIGATVFSLVFRGLGADELIRGSIESLPGGLTLAILCVMLVIFLLGFFLDFLEIIFIVIPVVAPILLGMELSPGVYLSPVWLGVMIAVNLQTSFLTPPFGFALFYLRGVAGESVSTGSIYRGVLPFVLLQISVLVILWLFPQLATWLPTRLYS